MNVLAFVPILSVMMLVHELGHFITAKLFGITVQEFGFGLPPRMFGFTYRGVVYSINWIPFGAFVKMLGEEDPTAPGSFAGKSRKVRAIVLAAGAAMNFLLAIVAFAIALMVGYPTISPTGPVRLAEVVTGTPAAESGLQAGDQITSLDGRPVNVDEFRTLTRDRADTPLRLGVRRGGSEVQVTATPRSNPPTGQGALGVRLDSNGVYQEAVGPALLSGVKQAGFAVGTTLMVPKLLMDGVITPQDARPIGLPGMARVTGEALDYVVDTGFWYPIFVLTGMFSAGLSVANLLPIPALDGGRLLFVFIEWVRGRRVEPEREAAYHFVGIVVLLALMVLISINDITSPIPSVNWGLR
ncbi:MAG: site-2 protease family protein [Chloroflexi bacterium]|nr:site-2 protease family protein [Chloroflexota bacterium]